MVSLSFRFVLKAEYFVYYNKLWIQYEIVIRVDIYGWWMEYHSMICIFKNPVWILWC